MSLSSGVHCTVIDHFSTKSSFSTNQIGSTALEEKTVSSVHSVLQKDFFFLFKMTIKELFFLRVNDQIQKKNYISETDY